MAQGWGGLMEAKIIQVATNQHGFRGKFRTLLEVPGGDFEPLLPAEPPLAQAVTLLRRLLLKTNPKHKLKINLARSDKYWV